MDECGLAGGEIITFDGIAKKIGEGDEVEIDVEGDELLGVEGACKQEGRDDVRAGGFHGGIYNAP